MEDLKELDGKKLTKTDWGDYFVEGGGYLHTDHFRMKLIVPIEKSFIKRVKKYLFKK